MCKNGSKSKDIVGTKSINKTETEENDLAENKCEQTKRYEVLSRMNINSGRFGNHRFLGTFSYTASVFDFCNWKHKLC